MYECLQMSRLQRFRSDRVSRRVTAVLLLLVLTTSVLAGTATAADELDLTVQAPTEVTVGDSVDIDAEVSLPDIVGSHSGDLTLTLSIDDERIDSQTVALSDGESTTVSFSPTLDSQGDHTINIEASVSVGGQSFSQSASKVITATASASEPTVTDADVVGETTTEISGASFTTPPTLEDEVASYRESVPKQLAPHTFVVATTDSVYLVFSESKPKTGTATVTGTPLQTSITARGMTFTPVVATDLSFSQTGQSASVSEITSNPDAYRLDLVQVTAIHRQAASITDPDAGNDFTASSTAGVLVEDPALTADLVSSSGTTARQFAINSSSDERGGATSAAVHSTLNATEPRLYTTRFQTGFWMDAPATVDGIVITPGSKARDYLAAFDRSGQTPVDESAPFLYVVNQDTETTQYSDVGTLQREASDGDTVSIDTNLVGKTLSVQETLEESTGCDDTKMKVQTTHGSACIDIVQDTLVHGGAAWTDIPDSRTDMLFVVGLSSRHQDQRTETVEGQYTLTGEVVSTSRIDPSLPDGKVLVVHNMERTDDLDPAAMGANTRDWVQNRSGRLESSLLSQIRQRDRGSVELSDDESGTETSVPDTTTETSPEDRDGGGGIVSGISDFAGGLLDGLFG